MKKAKHRAWRFALSPVAERGFSLVELVLVVSLLGLTSLVVLPYVERGLRDRAARRSALELAAVARDLRARAVEQGMPQRLTLDLSRNSYAVSGDPEVRLSPDARFAAVEGGETLESDIRQFLFFPNGSSVGGEIGIGAGAESRPYSVRLEPLTGRIEVSRGRRR